MIPIEKGRFAGSIKKNRPTPINQKTSNGKYTLVVSIEVQQKSQNQGNNYPG